MQEDQKPPPLSRPAAYGLLVTATAGTAVLAVASPAALAAGTGAVATSAAVFLSPVWRFIKNLNDLYVDTGMYLSADTERLRNGFSAKGSTAARQALAGHKPRFGRITAYTVLGATAVSATVLGLYAPAVLATAFGSIAISGASFTKPVIDLVQKVNLAYRDIYGYIRKDIFRSLPKLPELLPVDSYTELDKSISAPVSASHKPMSRLATYSLLAASVAGAAMLAVTAPAVLLAAAGMVLGDAISYTSPVLKFVKKLNRVYDETQDHIVESLDLSEVLGTEAPESSPLPEKKPAEKPEAMLPPPAGPHVSKPLAWVLAAGAVAGVLALAIAAPTLVTAAIGGILGSASSFTTPVLKQVAKVNDFYIDTCSYLKKDWQRATGRKPATPDPVQGPAGSMPAPTRPKMSDEELSRAFGMKAMPQQPQPGDPPAAKPSRRGNRPDGP